MYKPFDSIVKDVGALLMYHLVAQMIEVSFHAIAPNDAIHNKSGFSVQHSVETVILVLKIRYARGNYLYWLIYTQLRMKI